MTDLVTTGSVEGDAIKDSVDSLVVFVFAKTQSPYYKHAISIASGAFRYKEYPLDKTVIHTASFSRTPEQAARAIALLQYVGAWTTLQLFIAGRLHTGPVYELNGVLRCYQSAAHCNNHRAHCVQLSDVPFKREYEPPMMMSFQVVLTEKPIEVQAPSQPKPIRFFLPCRKMPDRRFLEKNHVAAWIDQIQALAVDLGVDCCPYFDLNEFRQYE